MCHLGMLAGKGRNLRNCRVYRLRGDGSNHPLPLPRLCYRMRPHEIVCKRGLLAVSDGWQVMIGGRSNPLLDSTTLHPHW